MYGYVYEGVSPRRPRANGNEKTSHLRVRSLGGIFINLIKINIINIFHRISFPRGFGVLGILL